MLKKNINHLIKGIYAGIMIGIGGTVYLSLDNKILGSFFFAIGLLVICTYKMNLYTGKIGYLLTEKKYKMELFLTLIGNFIGTYLVSFAVLNSRISNISEKAKILADIKLNDTFGSIIILSIFCGMLMFIAVNTYKKCEDMVGKYIAVFMCVMVFILCSFEHCIANMFYFSVSNMWSMRTFLYLLLMIVGNSIGAIFMSIYDNYCLNKK